MNWPIYEASQLVVGNLESPVAITTLWTNRENITSKLPEELYCVVGTLYNRKVGIDPLIRNLLARPTIRNIVICGRDLSRSGEALIKFFRHGFERGTDDNGNPKWRIELSDGDYGLIDIEVEEEALSLFRKSVSYLDMRGTEKGEDLRTVLEDLKASTCAKPYMEPKVFPKIIPTVTFRPAPESGRVFRSPTVVGAWLQAIKETYRFGVVGDTHYNPATEVLNFLTVITAEDPTKLFVPDWLPIKQKDVVAYCGQVLTPMLSHGARYGYGHRIFKYFGYDQLATAITKLAEDIDSKSAVISIWDPAKDTGDLVTPKSPCINSIWFRLRRSRLFMTVTIRSNDMGEAYLGNAFALRLLQAKALQMLERQIESRRGSLRQKILELQENPSAEKERARAKEDLEALESLHELSLGDLTINSESAHLYESSWVDVEKVLERHYKEVMKGAGVRKDPYGSFRITIDEKRKEIIVQHLSTNEDPLGEYRGRTALQLATMVVDAGIVSEPYHAVYLGRELEKAETALRLGIPYTQDSPLFKTHGPKPSVVYSKKP